MTVLSKACGVYQIRNLVNNKRYVGSAASLEGFKGRWKAHRNALKRGDHKNEHLLRSWRKYGEDAFVFEPILICAPEDCLIYEQFALDTGLFEYNICLTAESVLGRRHSEKTKAKIAASHKGLKHSVASKKKMRDAKRNGGAPGAKLNPDKVRRIHELVSDGITNRKIAKQFDIHESVISNIKAGRIWGYVK